MDKLVASIEINLSHIQDILKEDDLIQYRNFSFGDVSACLIYAEGMVDAERINDSILRPLLDKEPPFAGNSLLKWTCEKTLINNETRISNQFEELFSSLLRGDTILLLDGDAHYASLSTKGYEHRGVEEPQSELTLRGPRQGFNEVFSTNVSLIRRILPTPDLKLRVKTLGNETKTRVCVCYLGNAARPQMVEEVLKRLDKLDQQSLLDSNYIAEQISDAPRSIFKTVGTSERPDRIAANLLEGRVAIIVEGSPSVIWVPFLFIEYFQTHDDYYVSYIYATFARGLRFIGFLMSMSIPAIYLALICFHADVVPSSLLVSIMALRRSVPFPAVVEELLLLFAFELLLEAGIHSPSNVAQSLSIVGGIVLGQAAVDAKLVSAPMIIVVAVTGICGLMLTQTKAIIPTFRVTFLFLAALFGLPGYIAGMTGLLLYIASLTSFGIPYLHGFLWNSPRALLDGIFRSRWGVMAHREVPLPGRVKKED